MYFWNSCLAKVIITSKNVQIPSDPGYWDSQFDTYWHTTASQQMPRLKFTSRQKILQLPSGATCWGRCVHYVHHQLHACNPHTKARLLFLFHTLLSLSNLSKVTSTAWECKLHEFDAPSKHSQWKQRRERKNKQQQNHSWCPLLTQ